MNRRSGFRDAISNNIICGIASVRESRQGKPLRRCIACLPQLLDIWKVFHRLGACLVKLMRENQNGTGGLVLEPGNDVLALEATVDLVPGNSQDNRLARCMPKVPLECQTETNISRHLATARPVLNHRQNLLMLFRLLLPDLSQL